jgi:hypothetical protein
LYFNFFQFFSLWLTCRAKQFSSADVEGTDGDNKGAHGDAKGVQKMPKKPEKVQKKGTNKSVVLSAHVKRVVVSHMPKVLKKDKKGATKTQNKNIYIFVLQSAIRDSVSPV